MDISLWVRLQVNEQRVGRNNGCIDVIIERFIIHEFTERTLLRAHICDDGIHTIDSCIYARNSGVNIGSFHISYHGLKVRYGGIGIIQDCRYLMRHHGAQTGRNIRQIIGDTMYVRQRLFDMIAFHLRLQFRHKRIHIFYRR